MEGLETERGPVIPGWAGRMPETFRAEGISPPHPEGRRPRSRARGRSSRRSEDGRALSRGGPGACGSWDRRENRPSPEPREGTGAQPTCFQSRRTHTRAQPARPTVTRFPCALGPELQVRTWGCSGKLATYVSQRASLGAWR